MIISSCDYIEKNLWDWVFFLLHKGYIIITLQLWSAPVMSSPMMVVGSSKCNGVKGSESFGFLRVDHALGRRDLVPGLVIAV